jgi:cob(I)alamin adenosyltransferase
MTAVYKPGSGDFGYSNLLEGIYLRKDSPACRVQGSIEEVRNDIQRLLSVHDIYNPNLNYVLNWLNQNLFSLASFCYKRGDGNKYQFPSQLLEYLDLKILNLKQINEDCIDFTMQSNIKFINMDKVRISIRKLESNYIEWWYSEAITNFLMQNPHLIKQVEKHSSILNRLSAYLFECLRYEASIHAEKGENVSITYWKNYTEKFLPPN